MHTNGDLIVHMGAMDALGKADAEITIEVHLDTVCQMNVSKKDIPTPMTMNDVNLTHPYP
jgi:hypothetical protein